MKKKLHILFLCSWYPSKVLPKNGDYIQRHAEAVATQQAVTVLHLISDANINKSYIDSTVINGVNTHIGYIKESKNILIKSVRFLNLYSKILKKIDPIDFVHLNVLSPFGIFALHLKWFRKIKYLITEHSTTYLPNHQKKYPFLKKVF